MKEKLKRTVLLFTGLMTLGCIDVFSYDIEVKNEDGVTIYYDFHNQNELWVTCPLIYKFGLDNCNDYKGYVSIPEYVYYNGETYKVTAIYYNAFSICKDLTSVSIPNSVTHIWNGAFNGCTGLTSIKLSENLTYIANNAFDNCENLKEVHITDLKKWCENSIISDYSDYENLLCSIAHHLFLNGEEIKDLVIPEGVQTIRSYAFAGLTELKSVTIPASLTSIQHSAFDGCDKLKAVHISDVSSWCKITFGGNNPGFNPSLEDFQEYPHEYYTDYNGNPLCTVHHLYLNGHEIENLIIPESVTKISPYAFVNYENLRSVTLHNNITDIGRFAFANCTNLNMFEIPEGVKSIEEYAFYNCKGPTSLTIPKSVVTFDPFAIQGCKDIKNINIHSQNISGRFINLPNLENLTIDDMAYIYMRFKNCDNLKTVHCNLKKIGNWFREITNLQILHTGDKAEEISDEAFMGCKNLQSVVLGKGMKKIGQSAFKNCPNLESIYTLNPVPPKFYYSFDDSHYYYTNVYTPSDLLDIYKNDPIWRLFLYYKELDPESLDVESLFQTEPQKAERYYDLNGKTSNTPQHGLNIIRTNKGIGKKVMMK